MSKFSRISLWNHFQQKLPQKLKDSQIISNAFELAFNAHRGQERESRFADSQRVPYIVHPIGVAINTINFWQPNEIVESLEYVIASALLHDVIEDTKTNYHAIAVATNEVCANTVQSLTKPAVEVGHSREERNQIFISNYAMCYTI